MNNSTIADLLSELQKKIEMLERQNAILNGILNIGSFTSDECDFTSAPYWLIIKPVKMGKNDAEIASQVICAGVFFSRESAQKYLDGRRYEYGNNAFVYGFSGCRSVEYWTAIKNATNVNKKFLKFIEEKK